MYAMVVFLIFYTLFITHYYEKISIIVFYNNFYVIFCIFFSYFISVFIHEMGHLLLGLLAKFKFKSILVCGFYINRRKKITFNHKYFFLGRYEYTFNFSENLEIRTIISAIGGFIFNFSLFVYLFFEINVFEENSPVLHIFLLFFNFSALLRSIFAIRLNFFASTKHYKSDFEIILYNIRLLKAKKSLEAS